MIPARSIPWPRMATSRATGAWILVTPSMSSKRFQLWAASRVRGFSSPSHQDRDHGIPHGQAPRGHEPVAAVVARAGEDEHRAALATVVLEEGRAAAATAVPACSISCSPGIAQRLRLAVRAGHRPRQRSQSTRPASAHRSASSSRLNERQAGSSAGSGRFRRARVEGTAYRRCVAASAMGVRPPPGAELHEMSCPGQRLDGREAVGSLRQASSRSVVRVPTPPWSGPVRHGTPPRRAPRAGTGSCTNGPSSRRSCRRSVASAPPPEAQAGGFAQPRAEHRVRQVRPRLVERGDRVVARHLAPSEARELREDEPDPVARLAARRSSPRRRS